MATLLSPRPATPAFGELELHIVDGAKADGKLSLNPDGMLARLAKTLFAIPVARSLTNHRLEALRRFAVRAWHWDVVRDKDLRAFLEAGYSRGQALEILSRIGIVRGFTPSIEYDARPRLHYSPPVHRHCG